MKKKVCALASVLLSTCLVFAGCGVSKNNITTIGEAAPFNITSLTDASSAMVGATIHSAIDKNGNAIMKKQADGETYYGVFNFKSLNYVEPLAKVKEMQILDVIESKNTYLKTTYAVDGVDYCDVKIIGGATICEKVKTNVSLSAYKFGKTYYELWDYTKDDINISEVCTVNEKGVRTTVYTNQKVKGSNFESGDGNALYSFMKNTTLSGYLNYELASKLINYTAKVSADYHIQLFRNSDGKKVADYTLEDLKDSTVVSYCAGTKLITQKQAVVSSGYKKYTYSYDGICYQVTTTSTDLLTGKTKELKSDFVMIEKTDVEMARGAVACIAGYPVKDHTLGDYTLAYANAKFEVTAVKMAQMYGYNINKDRIISVGFTSASASTSVKDVLCITDKNGKVIFELDTDAENYFGKSAVMAEDTDSGKFALVDYDGKLRTGFVYDYITAYANDSFIAGKETKNGSVYTIEYFRVNEKTGAETYIMKEIYNQSAGTRQYYLGETQVNNIDFICKVGGGFAGYLADTLYYVETSTETGYKYTIYNVDGVELATKLTDTKLNSNDFDAKDFGSVMNEHFVLTVKDSTYTFINSAKVNQKSNTEISFTVVD